MKTIFMGTIEKQVSRGHLRDFQHHLMQGQRRENVNLFQKFSFERRSLDPAACTVPCTECIVSDSRTHVQPQKHSEKTVAVVDQAQAQITMWQRMLSSMGFKFCRCKEC
jgi:hypothetical protein